MYIHFIYLLFTLYQFCGQRYNSTLANWEDFSIADNETTILNYDGFENDQIATFWRPEFWTPTAGVIDEDLHRAGKQSLRINWQLSQVDGTNKMLHSELAIAPLLPEETERWYGYSSYMPSSTMANDNQPIIVSQWHGVPGQGEAHTFPPVAVSVEPGNKLQLVYRASNKAIIKLAQNPTSQKNISLGDAIFDQWIDYVVHIKWDPVSTTGLLQLWQNGKLIVNEANISIGYLEHRKPYWKAGIYCYTGKSFYEQKVIYFDEMRIGSPLATYDTVKPGRDNKSAYEQQK